MAPLRTRFNHTLHKINDKFKRQPGGSSHPPEVDAVHTQQPRAQPTGGLLLASGQLSASPQDIGLSSVAGEHVSQLPRSSASGSVTSVGQSFGEGFRASSPGSSMSVEFLDQCQVAAAPPPGTLQNPIDLHNVIDLTSTPSPVSPHGQKRYWAEPSLLDSVDVDYAIGQKSKMYRPASVYHTNVADLDCYGASMIHRAQADFQRQKKVDADLGTAIAWHNDLELGIHLRSTRYRSEEDLAIFGQKILATTCQKCSSPLFAGIESVINRTKDLLNAKGVLHPHLSCGKCKAMGCVACGVRNGQPGRDLPYHRTGPGISLAWCCDEGMLFLFWSLCCGPDLKKPESLNSQATLGRLWKGKLKGARLESASPIKAKEPPPSALSKGTGYGGDEVPILNSTTGGKWDTQLFQCGSSTFTVEEQLLAPYFAGLEILLSSFQDSQQPGAFDKGPPAMLKFMLRRSPLLPKAAELLRNDSMEAMSCRKETYEPLLGLIGIIGRQASISGVVYDDYMIYPQEEQLTHFTTPTSRSNTVSTSGSRSNQRGKGKQPEQGSSIASIVEHLARQCRHLNHVASGHIEELRAGESSKMLALSRTICDLAVEHEAHREPAADHVNSTMSGAAVLTQAASNVLTRSKEAEKAREDLKDLHRDASVMDLPDDELCLNFRFTREALEVNVAMAAKGRMKKLVAQIANLRTSLPEGIWVRHGSSRLDVMKVLMVGPKGTPYEHGLFEFDLFCPAEFPNKPPSVVFRTTGGGTVRFNPNLYEDGKVCLSILGTWSGETWNGAYSTLLQVLVSIHGMILVDQPWYNEPGRERMQNKTASKNYNTQIQQYTIQHALTNWLTQRLTSAKTATTNTSKASVVTSPSRTMPTGPAGIIAPYSAAVATAARSPGLVKDDPIWGDIIRKHFAANGKAIMETVKKWKQPAQGKDLISSLQDALSQHGFL